MSRFDQLVMDAANAITQLANAGDADPRDKRSALCQLAKKIDTAVFRLADEEQVRCMKLELLVISPGQVVR